MFVSHRSLDILLLSGLHGPGFVLTVAVRQEKILKMIDFFKVFFLCYRWDKEWLDLVDRLDLLCGGGGGGLGGGD